MASLFADCDPPGAGPYHDPGRLPCAPLASPADPLTSHEAGEQHARSGKLSANCRLVLRLIRENPGLTACELHHAQGGDGFLTRHEVSRRTADLKNAGLVRNGEARLCSVAGTKQGTWYTRT